MRGKALRPHTSRMLHRITPAYAGKSHAPVMQHPVKRDHPRVCGEKIAAPRGHQAAAGSPPRMRGKETGPAADRLAFRITPAYAGKRQCARPPAGGHQDHPRVCGEKYSVASAQKVLSGSPPRMRGKVHGVVQELACVGITPAYAGKRLHTCGRCGCPRDHPRVCGEKTGK